MARRLLFVIPLGCVLAALSSCGGGGGKPFADIVWQVRCPTPMMPGDIGCPQNGDVRDVNNLNGEDGHLIQCDVEKRGATDIISFTAFKPDGNGIRAYNITVPHGGGPVQGTCTIRVEDDDGANVYTGDCGANPPNATQPCQVSNVTFDTDDKRGIAMSIICKRIPNQAAPDRPRDITRAMESDSPFSVRLANCHGA